jgi:predicted nuclease of predicted toxin-antitoxin system
MRVLLDQATPVPIRRFLQGHSVSTAAREGWDRLQNGELLNAAEAEGFNVLVTTDKNMRYQQNLGSRKIAIVVLGKQQWLELGKYVQLVVSAINMSTPGAYLEIEMLGENESEGR